MVVGMFMSVVVVSSVASSRLFLQNNAESAKNMLISSIRKAQSYAISKKNSLTWGVCLTGRTIRMYGGSCASPTIKDDYLLPDSVNVSGLSDFTFSNFRGEPSSTQNISLSGNGQNFNLILNRVGGLSVE